MMRYCSAVRVPDPHAEVVDVESLPSPLRAHVAVVLLVDAVEVDPGVVEVQWRSSASIVL